MTRPTQHSFPGLPQVSWLWLKMAGQLDNLCPIFVVMVLEGLKSRKQSVKVDQLVGFHGIVLLEMLVLLLSLVQVMMCSLSHSLYGNCHNPTQPRKLIFGVQPYLDPT